MVSMASNPGSEKTIKNMENKPHMNSLATKDRSQVFSEDNIQFDLNMYLLCKSDQLYVFYTFRLLTD